LLHVAQGARHAAFATRVVAYPGPAYTDLRLDDDLLSNARIVELMVANPVLMNRLIVRTPHGIKLCRPAEEVAPLLRPI
jgi:arsenate reductase-like glutaredoxin family protein